MLRTTAGLHSDEARFAIRKMLEERGTLQLPVRNLARAGIHPVKLEGVLRDVYPDRLILRFGPSG
jgi:hypothetical protein